MKFKVTFPTNLLKIHALIHLFDNEGIEVYKQLFLISNRTKKEDIELMAKHAQKNFERISKNSVVVEEVPTPQTINELASHFVEPKDIV